MIQHPSRDASVFRSATTFRSSLVTDFLYGKTAFFRNTSSKKTHLERRTKNWLQRHRIPHWRSFLGGTNFHLWPLRWLRSPKKGCQLKPRSPVPSTHLSLHPTFNPSPYENCIHSEKAAGVVWDWRESSGPASDRSLAAAILNGNRDWSWVAHLRCYPTGVSLDQQQTISDLGEWQTCTPKDPQSSIAGDPSNRVGLSRGSLKKEIMVPRQAHTHDSNFSAETQSLLKECTSDWAVLTNCHASEGNTWNAGPMTAVDGCSIVTPVANHDKEGNR